MSSNAAAALVGGALVRRDRLAVARDHRDMFLNAHHRFFAKVCDPEPCEAMVASDIYMLYPVTLVDGIHRIVFPCDGLC